MPDPSAGTGVEEVGVGDEEHVELGVVRGQARLHTYVLIGPESVEGAVEQVLGEHGEGRGLFGLGEPREAGGESGAIATPLAMPLVEPVIDRPPPSDGFTLGLAGPEVKYSGEVELGGTAGVHAQIGGGDRAAFAGQARSGYADQTVHAGRLFTTRQSFAPLAPGAGVEPVVLGHAGQYGLGMQGELMDRPAGCPSLRGRCADRPRSRCR